MSRFAGRIDVRTALVVGAAVALIGAYWAAVALSQNYYLADAPEGSSYSSAPGGTRVLASYLGELGIETDTLQTFETLPLGGTIVVVAPEVLLNPPSDAEVARLRRWVEGGGRLVLVGVGAEPLAGEGLSGRAREGRDGALLRPLLPVRYAHGVERVKVGPERVLVDSPRWATVLKDRGGQALLVYAVGEGEVVWLASSFPVSNGGIGEADNARFATLLAAGATPVHFDEYHHGFVRGGGVWQRLGQGGRAAALLGLLGVAVLLWSVSRRIGPPIAVGSVREARTGAYIGSLAGLYRAAGARAPALASLAEGLRTALARRYGSVEAGIARDAGAREALQDALNYDEAAGEDRFVSVARGIARARREVEGRDG